MHIFILSFSFVLFLSLSLRSVDPKHPKTYTPKELTVSFLSTARLTGCYFLRKIKIQVDCEPLKSFEFDISHWHSMCKLIKIEKIERIEYRDLKTCKVLEKERELGVLEDNEREREVKTLDDADDKIYTSDDINQWKEQQIMEEIANIGGEIGLATVEIHDHHKQQEPEADTSQELDDNEDRKIKRYKTEI